MTPGPEPAAAPDEFETIERLFAPLAGPGGLQLLDDAAVLPARPGYDLVLTKDALVEGVHFLPGDPLDLVARKLLRVNLSDLAAKAAEPAGYLLACAWSPRCGWPERTAFAAGLAHDQALFGVALLGGDTVTTPGPLTLSATLLGWAPEGTMVRRSGARPGDRLYVSGTIGDGALGLLAARGQLDLPAADVAWLADRYRLPRPRLDLRAALRAGASAAADISDGLAADAGRIARASGFSVSLDLARLPLSPPAARWLAAQPDEAAARLQLATGGDDYELVATAADPLPGLAEIGRCDEGRGVRLTLDERVLESTRLGWRHS